MASLDSTEVRTVLTEIVDPRVKLLQDKSRILWNLIDRGTPKETNARGVRVVAEAHSNPSMLWFPEGGKYPPGGTRRFIPMNITYARFAIAARMTRDALEQPSAQLIVSDLFNNVKSDTMTALKEFNQQAYRDGSGVKAVVQTRDSGTQVTFALPFRSRQLIQEGNYNFYAGTARTTNGTPYVVGQKIGTGTSTISATGGSINNSTGAVVFDTVHADVIAGDVLTYENSYGRAIHGLDYIVDNGTGLFQNASRADYSQLRSIVDDAAGAALSVARLNKLMFQVKYLRGTDRNGISGRNMVIISSPTQANRYVSLADVGSNGNVLNDMPGGRAIDLGYTAYKFMDMAWIEDVDCPDDVIYMLDLDSIDKYELKPLRVVPLVGNDSGLAPIPGFDANGVGSYYDAGMYVMTGKFDLGSSDPQRNMKIKNLSTTGYATGNF
jgi:hypothetical protein